MADKFTYSANGITLTEEPENETQQAVQQLETMSNENNKTIARNKIMNFATSQEMEIDPNDFDSWQRANNALAAAYQEYQDNPDASAWDVRSAMGDNYADFAQRYGGSKRADAVARDIFMVAPRSSVLRAARSLSDNYGKYQAERKKSAEDAERQAVAERNRAAWKFKSDDGYEVDIPRTATDFLRQKRNELLYATDDEKAAIYREIQGQLSELTGGRIPMPTDKDAPMKSYMDILSKADNVSDRMLADDILYAAENRPEEQYKPKQDDKDMLTRFAERQERQYKREKEQEDRRIAMQRLGRDFAGLAAVIGDTIRAHEGAPVSQRDWQQIYDNLTAQERANVNNYQVRMQKLKDDIRAQRMAQEAAADAAREKATDRAFKKVEADKDRHLRWEIAKLRDKQNRYYAYLRWGQGGKDDKSKTHELLMIGDKAMLVRKGQSFTNAINSLNQILEDEASYKVGRAHSLSVIGDITLESDPQQYWNRNTQAILSEYWDDLTKPAKDKIIKKLLAMQGEWVQKKDDAAGTKSVEKNTEDEEDKVFDPNDPNSWF